MYNPELGILTLQHRSLEVLPPVTKLFGDIRASEGLTTTSSIGTPNCLATVCATFVFSPKKVDESLIYIINIWAIAALIQTEGDSLLRGGISLMTHFMEQKLRQIFKKVLLFCRLSTKL